MREYMLTFVSDNVDKMQIFGALLDAGFKDFVISEMYDYKPDNCKGLANCEEENCVECEKLAEVPKNKTVDNCFRCTYARTEGIEIHCMRDDVYLSKEDAECKCDCFIEAIKKIELIEE